jgi:hypothetical protein
MIFFDKKLHTMCNVSHPNTTHFTVLGKLREGVILICENPRNEWN